MIGEEARTAISLEVMDWAAEVETAGEGDLIAPLSHPDYGSIEPAWQGRLFFAGSEAAMEGGGYMEGAVEFAERIARTLLEKEGHRGMAAEPRVRRGEKVPTCEIPIGSAHAPYSSGGCVLFVKLRQMCGNEVARKVTPTPALPGWSGETELHIDSRERVLVQGLGAGASSQIGERGNRNVVTEVLLLDGEAHVDGHLLRRWDWHRRAGVVRLDTARGTRVWTKTYLADTNSGEVR